MNDKNQHLDDIAAIRSIMERSSKFLSLSGLSGISVGLAAIVSACVAYFSMGTEIGAGWSSLVPRKFAAALPIPMGQVLYYLALAITTLLVALALAFFFTRRKSRKMKLPMWSKATKLLLFNLAVPFFTGGIFVLVLIFRFGMIDLVAASALIFYGLALFGGSKYTVRDVKILGLAEIVLGLFAMVFVQYGLLFLATGFGVFHIAYGTVLYFKYEAKS